jgi:hypothetical protein
MNYSLFSHFTALLSLFLPFALAAGNITHSPADSRVDITWSSVDGAKGYNIYRSDFSDGEYLKLNKKAHPVEVYSDWIGKNANGRKFYYKVKALQKSAEEIAVNDRPVESSPFSMNEDQLLTSIQHATFRYFWDYAHKDSGLIKERYYSSRGACASGGTGFGVLALMIGVERGFVTREQGVERLLKIVRFLGKADRFHGAWSHWLNGRTGKVIRFSKDDDGGDIVETALLMQGLLTVRQYFDGDLRSETELRSLITELWHTVEWNWYLKDENSGVMYWHWSPNFGWEKNHKVRGYNECMIVYLLGVASPTYPIPATTWQTGWAGGDRYLNGQKYYGIKQEVGIPMGGPLFLSQYSFTCFDPRNKRDQYTNYYNNSRAISQIHQAYCNDNPQGFKGYSDRVWGLTACDGPDGYSAFAPGEKRDNGTIAPTAAIGSFPFTPKESMAALKHFYYEMGDRLWGPFGFYDSFNQQRDWVAKSHIAIDQGPINGMIENYRTGLCWKNFMKNPEIAPMLKKIGFVKD